MQCCRSEEEGLDARGEEGEVEELLSKSKLREEERLGKSVTCSTLLSKSKSREGGELEDTCSTLPTAPTESSLNAPTRYAIFSQQAGVFLKIIYAQRIYANCKFHLANQACMVLLPGLPANSKMESIVGNFEIPERGGANFF